MATPISNGITHDYEITVGSTRKRVTGTADEVMAMVDKLMEGQPQGVVPTMRKVDAPSNVTPLRRGIDVCQEGKARSTDDLLAAQAAGFDPKRPLYDRGTLLVGWGVDNARKSRVNHDAKPSVGEAVAGLLDTIKAEGRHDVLCQPEKLAMRGDGLILKPGEKADGEGWYIEQDALSQLASRVGIEQPGYLHGVWPELRAMNWNQHLATMIGHEKSTCPPNHPVRKRLAEQAARNVFVRLRKSSTGQGEAVWSAMSERYTAFDVDKIALALERGLRAYPDAKCEIVYDGRSARFDVLFHSNVKPEHYVAGEFFLAGIRVTTHDGGGGSVRVSLMLWQNLCLNLIILDVGQYNLASLRHIGDVANLAARFNAAVEAGTKRLEHFLRAWGYACEESLAVNAGNGYKPGHLTLLDDMPTDTVSESDLIAGVFRGIIKEKRTALVKDDLPGLLAAHALDNSGARQLAPVTRASIVNAITRHAHENVGRFDPARESELEANAGALLVSRNGRGNPSPLPFLPL